MSQGSFDVMDQDMIGRLQQSLHINNETHIKHTSSIEYDAIKHNNNLPPHNCMSLASP